MVVSKEKVEKLLVKLWNRPDIGLREEEIHFIIKLNKNLLELVIENCS